MGYKAVLESSIMQKGLPATAGSKMLADFIAPVDADVVERLLSAGVEIAGRADSSEFGVGDLYSVRQGTSPPVAYVADGKADFALCNDYTGAISRAAADAGLYYVHPTYGTVSRYGLIPSVCSIDQIGVVCKSPDVGFWALEMVTREPSPCHKLLQARAHGSSQANFCLSIMANSSLMLIMQIICSAELANNVSRYDGIKFGYRAKGYNNLEELYKKSRSEAFGEDVKLAVMIGATVLSQENYTRYYDKAMRIRRMIRDSLEFDNNVIKTDNPLLSRLCGLPSLTTPDHVYIADAGCENMLEAVCKDVGGDA